MINDSPWLWLTQLIFLSIDSTNIYIIYTHFFFILLFSKDALTRDTRDITNDF